MRSDDGSETKIAQCPDCGAPAAEFIEEPEFTLEDQRKGHDEDVGTADLVYCGRCGAIIQIQNLETERGSGNGS